ncbi:MAG: hypothetical protein Q7J82_03950 [Coriobacteriia bacterium]|nr:hypothetical protein [Coriobacteriia bacterium]
MEFSLICPKDGTVDLGLEDISAVVLRGPESIDIVFTCPRCGSQINASLRVPNLLMAAMELAQYAERVSDEDSDLRFTEGPLTGRDDGFGDPVGNPGRLADSYCEYFRRQLAEVECVEDLLAEIDSR